MYDNSNNESARKAPTNVEIFSCGCFLTFLSSSLMRTSLIATDRVTRKIPFLPLPPFALNCIGLFPVFVECFVVNLIPSSFIGLNAENSRLLTAGLWIMSCSICFHLLTQKSKNCTVTAINTHDNNKGKAKLEQEKICPS